MYNWEVQYTDDLSLYIVDKDTDEIVAHHIPSLQKAKFMAASPDLENALINLVIGIDMGWDLGGLIEQAREALNKVGP